MDGESMWIERAQSAEAKLVALRQAYEPALDRVREFKANFGVRERSDGTIDIDFEKLVDRLGLQSAFELRALIDARYHISGAPGEKPRVRLPASAQAAAQT